MCAAVHRPFPKEARLAAFSFEPQAAIAVDVTFAADHPNAERKQYGDIRLGGGPMLSRGSANSPAVYDMLVAIAERGAFRTVCRSTRATPAPTLMPFMSRLAQQRRYWRHFDSKPLYALAE